MKEFKSFIKQNGYAVAEEIDLKRVPYEIIIQKDERKVKIVMFYKNITGAGWRDKPHIKRVQVSNVRKGDASKYVSTSSGETFIILGYYN